MLFNINVIQNKILLSQIKNTKILISIITIAVIVQYIYYYYLKWNANVIIITLFVEIR